LWGIVLQRTRIVYCADPAPPPLACPSCTTRLVYQQTVISGVQPERWDLFTCATCGEFEYRHRTRRLRAVIEVSASHRVLSRIPKTGES
jgi:uncharacterized Zn finger protein